MFLQTIEVWFLWVMIYSVIGWIYESTLCSVTSKRLINRGFLNGPYCPIYGSGALSVVLALGKINNPIILFILGAVLTCSLEYLTSYFMEKQFHARWWDYSDRKFNINGRVCLLGAIVFGAFSVILVLLLHPFVKQLTDFLTDSMRHIVCLLLLTVLTADYIVTVKGMEGFRDKLNEIEKYLTNQKNIAMDKIHMSDAYQAINEHKELIANKLNRQQQRMIASFPALKMKNHNEMLKKIRETLKRK